MTPAKKTIKVFQLKKGDKVTGGEILADPVTPMNTSFYGKNKMLVKIRYSNSGKECTQVWGKNTTITIHE